MRPWKAEQLGGGYALSSWVERTAYEGAAAIIAVSAGMRDDVLRSYPSSTPRGCTWSTTASTPTLWSPVPDPDRVARARRRPRPAERHLRRPHHPAEGPAATSCARPPQLPPDVQLVLCAGAPDTPEIEAEVRGLVDGAAPRPATASSGSPRCCRAPTWSRC